jgi:1,4-dihydroxy-2-naphthoyl-CoA synthase
MQATLTMSSALAPRERSLQGRARPWVRAAMPLVARRLRAWDAATAERWGLVNEVVPAERLLDTAREWARKIGSYSPTALKFLKHSFNADTDHLGGLSHLAFDGLELFTSSDEGMEGARAFAEKRDPDFGQFR